jgi:hypothetical protein
MIAKLFYPYGKENRLTDGRVVPVLVYQSTKMCGNVGMYKHSTRWRFHIIGKDHLVSSDEKVNGSGRSLHVAGIEKYPRSTTP